jgi:hypothetical protein
MSYAPATTRPRQVAGDIRPHHLTVRGMPCLGDMSCTRPGWLAAGLLAAIGLAGCATGSGAYSEPEQARIDAYERAAEQVLQSRGMKGPAPVVRVGTDPSLAAAGRPAGYYTDQGRAARSGMIVVNRAAVADDYIAQAVLSQELAHYVLGHAEGACRERRLECEIEARIASVELLMTGWGLEYSDAIRLQYAYLKSVVLAAQRGDVPAAPGKSDPCRELQEFATRFKASASCE